MSESLTGTRHFGFSARALADALQVVGAGQAGSLVGQSALATQIGVGTIQLEALGAWMRFANIARRDEANVVLTPFGQLVYRFDNGIGDLASWWALHWQLASNYVVWRILGSLGYRRYDTEDIDRELAARAPGRSQQTIRNARQSLIKALEDTPLGQELGLVRLESDGKRVTGLVKLPVRHGAAPMAAVAYAILDWATREQARSAALESLAASDGPGAVLHMSEGVLERYLLEIDGAFRGRVLTYSRTAGLNEAYFKPEVAPLQVLAAHYIRERDGLEWPEALTRAEQEVGETRGP